MPPLSKPFPPSLALPFSAGLLTPNLTSIFDYGRISPDLLPADVAAESSPLSSRTGSVLALSTIPTFPLLSLGLCLLDLH